MSWFSGGQNPANAGGKYWDQIPGATQPYYQPYIDQGRQAGQDLTGRYNTSLNDPGSIYDQIGKGYKESPGYQARLKAGLQGATNAAAAGGMAGSPEHALHAAETANDLQGKDYEDYLNHVFGIYNQGIEGEQGRESRGYDASKGYADILGNNLSNRGAAEYNATSGRNASHGQMISNFINLLGTIGGGIVGGPIGGAIGSAITKRWGK